MIHARVAELSPGAAVAATATVSVSSSAAGSCSAAEAHSARRFSPWTTWLWTSQVERVITTVRERAAELGQPTDDDSPTSVRVIVWTTLGYLENQQSRIDYASHRRAGLPITSSHMESAVKELNQRIKGSEKF